MSGWIARALSPSAEVSSLETGLRFTDILFGFVISQLFLRILHWDTLPWFLRLQLICGTVLVLGSWIGFRRSLNRSFYEVKFFNLPFFRFLLDQSMVILYFLVATRAPNTAHPDVPVNGVTQATVQSLFFIWVLYLSWDFLAVWMSYVKRDDTLKYPRIDANRKRTAERATDWWGFGITAVFTLLLGVLYWTTHGKAIGGSGADARLITAIVLLLLYRFVKEVRSTFKSAGAGPAGSTQSSA